MKNAIVKIAKPSHPGQKSWINWCNSCFRRQHSHGVESKHRPRQMQSSPCTFCITNRVIDRVTITISLPYRKLFNYAPHDFTLPSSVNSTKAKRSTELGSPHIRQSTTFTHKNDYFKITISTTLSENR